MFSLKPDVEVHGLLFRNSVSQSLRHQLGRAVEELAVEGAKLVRETLHRGIKRGTGFTEGNVEGFSYKRGMYVNGSLYGKVRLRENLSRGPGGKYPASRAPYIVNAVLESGGYGGGTAKQAGPRVGRRRGWYSGTRHSRQALHQFRTAAKVLRKRATQLRVDLGKDLR